MSYDDLDQAKITTRLRAILKALSQVEDAREEERLLNEQLFLRGVLAGLEGSRLRKGNDRSMKARRVR